MCTSLRDTGLGVEVRDRRVGKDGVLDGAAHLSLAENVVDGLLVDFLGRPQEVNHRRGESVSGLLHCPDRYFFDVHKLELVFPELHDAETKVPDPDVQAQHSDARLRLHVFHVSSPYTL
jgi:hypothetical protein